MIIKNISVLGEGSTREFITAEAKSSIAFSRSQTKFCLSLIIMDTTIFLFVNATKTYQFKAKASEIKSCPLCLGNITKDVTANNKKKSSVK